MKLKDLLRLFNVNDLRLLPEAVLPVVLSNSQERDILYRELIELNGFDMSYDWFQSIYEEDLSDRKHKKQDFTPRQVADICSCLTESTDGSTHEPTAGTGSLLISNWWRKALAHIPFDFYPSRNPIECWEISDRSIPILLLNLSIRGIVGIVHHGDVLEKKEQHCYRLVNPMDDCLGFSKVYAL